VVRALVFLLTFFSHADNASTGACILYGISRVVIGENKTFLGGEAYLKQRGIEVVVLEDTECRELMEGFIKEKPEVW
jgi:cytosine/creatinine deaminase